MTDDNLITSKNLNVRFAVQHIVEKAQIEWQQGDFSGANETFGQLFQVASPFLLGIAESKGLNEDEANDVVAETLINLWQVIERGEVVTKASGLMVTILKRRIIDFWRDRYGRSKESQDEDKETAPFEMREADGGIHSWDDVPSDAAPEHEEVNDRAFRAVLNPILLALSKTEQQVLLLRFYEDLTVDETAKRLDISPDVVKKRTASALKRARAVAVAQKHVEAEVLP